jgi:hypothetical protein
VVLKNTGFVLFGEGFDDLEGVVAMLQAAREGEELDA